MTNKTYTMLEIADRFEAAVATMRRLPSVKAQGYFNTWPETVKTIWEKLSEEKCHHLGPPSPIAISRMEETINWIFWLEEEERKIIWLRASKVKWKAICWRMGYGKTKTRNIWTTALLKISTKLNQQPKK